MQFIPLVWRATQDSNLTRVRRGQVSSAFIQSYRQPETCTQFLTLPDGNKKELPDGNSFYGAPRRIRTCDLPVRRYRARRGSDHSLHIML